MTNRRLDIIAANYGRNGGWYIEHAGRVIAVAEDPMSDDMFWTSYRILPTSPEDRDRLGSNDFWDRCDFTLRSRTFGEPALLSFPCGCARDGFRETGRVSLRGDYIDVPTHWWDSIALWIRDKPRR